MCVWVCVCVSLDIDVSMFVHMKRVSVNLNILSVHLTPFHFMFCSKRWFRFSISCWCEWNQCAMFQSKVEKKSSKIKTSANQFLSINIFLLGFDFNAVMLNARCSVPVKQKKTISSISSKKKTTTTSIRFVWYSHRRASFFFITAKLYKSHVLMHLLINIYVLIGLVYIHWKIK